MNKKTFLHEGRKEERDSVRTNSLIYCLKTNLIEAVGVLLCDAGREWMLARGGRKE